MYNVSVSPHLRAQDSTKSIMGDVAIALLPILAFGIYHFGLPAFFVTVLCVVSSVLFELLFELITKRPITIFDNSALVTGLILAVNLPASVPWYIPVLGSAFAIIIVKMLFGGLGQNFMNPALGARCFLLLSFSSIVADYTVDGYSSATPLAELAAGNAVNVFDMLLGNTSGVIGNSVLALFVGGLILWAMGGITIEIPAAVLISFSVFIALFGGHGLDPAYILIHLAGGGIVMGAFFMATDPVTSPVTSMGQIIYGAAIGILAGVFRVFGSAADSVSYAIIMGNLLTPLIEEVTVPVPYGNRKPKEEGAAKKCPIPMPALILLAITVIAGVCLSGVHEMTADIIAEQQAAAKLASYQEVCPAATDFEHDAAIDQAIADLNGEVYGTDFGKAYINEMVVGKDASGNVAGYVISVTSGDGYAGNISLSVGISADGTINGIAFTELNETAGMGMKCADAEFKDQFNGVNTDKFTLNKAGGSTADNEIDSVSGASTSSGAVVNAVNAAIDFYTANAK